MKWSFLLPLCLATAAGTGCGGGGGGQFYEVAIGSFPALTGTDCAGSGMSTTTITFSGIDGQGSVAIYPLPNSEFFLDLGGGGFLGSTSLTGLTGTQNGSTYTFKGTWTDDITGAGAMTTTYTITVTMTTSGQTMTGSVALSLACSSTNGDLCGSGNPLTSLSLPLPTASTDKGNFTCSSSATLLGTQISSVQAGIGEGTKTPTPVTGE